MFAYPLFVLVTFTALQAPATAFDGKWTAEYRGVTHVRLTLQTTNGVTSGTISLGDLEVGTDGAIVKVAEAPKVMKPIIDVRRRGAVLAFGLRDGENTDQLEVAVVGDGLELTLVLSEEDRRDMAADGISAPKPIRLTRAK